MIHQLMMERSKQLGSDFTLKLFFDELSIPNPDYNLNISSLSHGAMTGRQLEGIEKILLDDVKDE